MTSISAKKGGFSRRTKARGHAARWQGSGRGHSLAFWVSAASPSFSMPTSDIAIFLNRLLTLCPAFADVSMNMMLSSVAFAFASSSVTCLRRHATCEKSVWWCQNMSVESDSETNRLSERSALLPTSTMITSFPLSERTSSIHLDVDMNDWRSVVRVRCQPSRTKQALGMRSSPLTGDIKNNNGD